VPGVFTPHEAVQSPQKRTGSIVAQCRQGSLAFPSYTYNASGQGCKDVRERVIVTACYAAAFVKGFHGQVYLVATHHFEDEGRTYFVDTAIGTCQMKYKD
jgi:hypothetical protein